MPTQAHDHSWMKALRGRFVVFEGPDGSGKTTQFRRFLKACADAGVSVCEVREPGGTGVGEKIRAVLLDHAHHDMALTCEMLLYMASRAQLVEQRIKPALARGEFVAADRFVSSTLAYQGTAGGLSLSDIRAVAAIATHGLTTDLVVIFDVDEHTAAARINPLLGSVRAAPDRMEAKGREFQAKVRRGYLEQAQANPKGHFVIDASKSPEEVWESLVHGIREKLS